MDKEKYNVLLVDDSTDDRWLLRRILRNHPKLVIVGEVADGDDAIARLGGQPPFDDREKHPFPDVLLLDLKMPRKTGYDVLQWLAAQPFKDLIIVVLSGSFLPEDIARSFALGAHAYHTKSAVGEDQQAMVHEIESLLRKRKS